MPDFFVAPTGSDSNDGSSARPFRSITRATAAAVAARGTGNLRVANGVYDRGSGEDFPISVPPGYVLRGSSRTDTRIHYSRSSSGPRGLVAIEAGSGVRRITLRAGPPDASDPVACTTAIRATINDSVIQNVRILASRPLPDPRPDNLEDWPSDLGVFVNAIDTTSVLRTAIVDCRVEWHQLSWLSGGTVVTGCTFDDAPLMIDGATVSGCTFLGVVLPSIANHLWCGINTQNEVNGNTFRGYGFVLDAANFPVRAGGGPTIRGNVFERSRGAAISDQGDGAQGLFEGNEILNPMGHTTIHLTSPGSSRFVGNLIETDSLDEPSRLLYTAGLTRPSFERNVFREPFSTPPTPPSPYFSRIMIRSYADFGGGGNSGGGNDFRELNLITCLDSTTEVFLRSNTWRDSADPMAQISAGWGAVVRL